MRLRISGNVGRFGIRKSDKGFTLVEVILAAMILTIGILGIIRALVNSLNALTVSRNYIDSVSLAKEKIVEIRQSEEEKGGLPAGGSQGKFQDRYSGFSWESEIVATEIKGLNRVKVTVFNGMIKPVREFTLVSYVENKNISQ